MNNQECQGDGATSFDYLFKCAQIFITINEFWVPPNTTLGGSAALMGLNYAKLGKRISVERGPQIPYQPRVPWGGRSHGNIRKNMPSLMVGNSNLSD